VSGMERVGIVLVAGELHIALFLRNDDYDRPRTINTHCRVCTTKNDA
jgi:hypothetical protein